ncbi:MAG: response regulator, partial [Anaerolineales bacterium]
MSDSRLVLVVDDEIEALEILSMHLEGDGYRVMTATSGIEGLRLAYDHQPDAVILDIRMPGMDGREVCARLRDITDAVIIFATVVTESDETVRALQLGADDYVTKPIEYRVLAARLEAHLRRRSSGERIVPAAGPMATPWKIDEERREVVIDDRQIKLTPKEFEVFQMFIQHPDKVLSAGKILAMAWGPEYLGDQDLVKQFIYRLRSKLEVDPSNPKIIVTVRGAGYLFEPDAAPESPPKLEAHERLKRDRVTDLRERAQERLPALIPTALSMADTTPSVEKPSVRSVRAWFAELPRVNAAWLAAPLAVAVLILGSVVAQASVAAIPGDGTYPFKLLVERAQLMTTLDEQRALELRLEFVQRRVEELTSLAETGRTDQISSAVQRFEGEVDQTIRVIPRDDASSPPTALLDIDLEMQLEELTALHEQ